MTVTVRDIRQTISGMDDDEEVVVEIEQSGTVIGQAERVDDYFGPDGRVGITVSF